MATSIFGSFCLRAMTAVLCLGMAACATGNDRGGGGGDDDDENGSGSGEADRWGGVLPTVQACVYPATGYGKDVGTIAPQLKWQGFAEGSTTESEISIDDFYDCHGTRGINAVLLIGSSMTCGVCQQEATGLEAHTAGDFAQMGIKVATLMMASVSGGPASTSDANQWKNQFGLQTSAVVADPGFSFAIGGTVGTPLHVVIDPRTMEIVHRVEGWNGQYTELMALAQQNAQQP